MTPIAIVGMAFRFPGDLGDTQSFWQALAEGRDLVGHVGPERWATDELQHPKRSEPGRSVTFSAGVLSRIDEFDAGFFGISPREAAWLDPQQRLLLELAWEVMENSGRAPSSLAGSDCAVYVGISGVDYGMRAMDDLSGMSAHSMTGNTLSIAANRLSYVFDLHGPSVAVDTACSSSLVALHQACNSLRLGEASQALVGGVNLLLHPYPFIGFTKASMLSANGRCRAFDASGDGYVRGEGGAILLLKPLENALADGDDIHAVILATGANSDGHRKTGITIPSSEGQAELMRSVLRRSGLSPSDIDYIEAHGTGTAVGDPIETAAISEVYGSCRPEDRPLPIGSVKTNLGHLEPASGMAGLIKAILVLKNRALPPSLHLQMPNPRIDFSGWNLDVVTEYRPLPELGGKKLVVGVNSFGFGGTNAHVLLQEFPLKRVSHTQPESADPPLFLSARTEQALADQAAQYADLLRRQSDAYYDIAHGAAFRRERLEKRLALKPGDPVMMAERLAAFAQGETASGLVREDALAQSGGVAFIYSGNGAQWQGMGQRLLAESPRFAELMAGLDTSIRALAGFSIVEELKADHSTSRLDDTAVAQPLLFAIQVAVTTLLREQGIEPQAVAGHSVGEVAAAWASGALSLEQAIEVICVRSSAQALTRGTGRMAVAGLSETQARELIASEGLDGIEIAGINSPKNITVAGCLADLERLNQILQARGVFYRQLDLDYAFHSRFMDEIESTLVERLASLSPEPATVCTYVSTVTGGTLSGSDLDAGYWWRNVRHPVRFAQAIAAMAEQGCRIFVEIGPHAILQRYLNECLAARNISGRALPTMRRNDDGWDRIEEAALRCHLLVEPPRLDIFFPKPGHRVQLPNYPWQRERYWHPRTSEANGLIDRRRSHPLLGWRLKEAVAAWENTLDLAICPWLADHKVANGVVLPGAAYVEMALAAAREWFGGSTGLEVEDLEILAPIVFDGEHARTLRFELSPRDGSFQIRSRQRLSEDEWTINAVGRLPGPLAVSEPDGWHPPGDDAEETHTIDHETHYRLTESIGLEYGPAFRGLQSAQVQGNTLEAALASPSSVSESASHYLLHPALLDLCFQSLVDFFQEEIEEGRGIPFLPVKVGRLRLFGEARVAGFRSALKRRGARSVQADFALFDTHGNIIATLTGCRFRAAAVQRRGQAEPACWRIVPRLQPLPEEQRESTLPPNRELTQRLTSWFLESEESLKRGNYFKGALPLFEALVVAFVHEAFQQLFDRRTTWLQQVLSHPEELDQSVRPFFLWLVRTLEREDLLVEEAGVWRLEPSNMPPSEEIWRTLLRDCANCLPELVMAGCMGRHLAQWLEGVTGSHSPGKEQRNIHQLEALYDDSHSYLGTRLAVQQVLGEIAADWPSNRRLRVLEITCGTSGLIRHLAADIDLNGVDYLLAHDGPEGYERLRAEYGNHPSVRIAAIQGEGLELEADEPVPELFDVIVLRHWLHRANDPVAELIAARRRLATGGVLILAERYPDLSADFISGAFKEWWRVRSETAPASSLMPPQAWEVALSAQGFDEIETFHEPASGGLPEGGYLLLAKKPAGEAIPAVEPEPESWLLLCDADGPSRVLGDRLQRLLESQGQRVVTIPAGTHSAEEGAMVFDPHTPGSASGVLETARQHLDGLDHLVYLVGLGEEASHSGVGLELLEKDRCIGALHLVHAMVGSDTDQPRLWLVTAGGALASGLSGVRNPLQATLWGFGRVVMNEYPALDCTLIDLEIDPAAGETAHRLQAELLQPDGEKEIVLSSRGRHGLRMERISPAGNHGAEEPPSRFRLDFHVPGHLRNLVWLAQPERPLAEDEVEVRVLATGLNFRDVMYLMGLLPDEAVENGFAGASLGLEFSGVITRVGKRVDEFAEGDAVMGFGPACFASHVITKANAVTHKPEEWSYEAAATVPTVFFTVYYALKHLADLQPGERVLIHGAAGGVGIAAVQLARHLGAEVFATAGSEEKRDFVKLLGADHVFDSRSLAFADQILALTDGEGVDVVLNSLAGEAIRRNLRVLKPFGRFLELGKRDFFENTPIGLRPFKDNISYFGIDADQLLLARPALATRLFRELMALFRGGALFPLPYQRFSAKQVVDAFRTMQQARQIGKVVVSLDQARVSVEASHIAQLPAKFRKEATYVVTGGLTGFGLESARWLAEHGAGQLVLVGRRGGRTPGVDEAVNAIEALGARVKVVACDITDPVAVRLMLREIQQHCPPLSGILHAAMVLDDALIMNLDAGQLHKVLAPKLLGAWHLHRLTLDIPLEHFILYSSVTTFIGNPGQANYVAANAYLEGLASLRRTLGLAVTCIGWGPIGDAGYLTRNQAVKERLSTLLGAAPLTARQALNMLDPLLTSTAETVAIADFDWGTLARLLPSAQEARFAELRRQAGTGGAMDSGEVDFRTFIIGKTPGEVRSIIQNLVSKEIAQILCVAADRIDPAQSLHDLGMDSLMGVELVLGLEERFGIQLPGMMLSEGPTIERVSARIAECILGEQEQDSGDHLDTMVTTLAAQHGEDLSADELENTAKQVKEQARTGIRLIS